VRPLTVLKYFISAAWILFQSLFLNSKSILMYRSYILFLIRPINSRDITLYSYMNSFPYVSLQTTFKYVQNNIVKVYSLEHIKILKEPVFFTLQHGRWRQHVSSLITTQRNFPCVTFTQRNNKGSNIVIQNHCWDSVIRGYC
jgi:hypothetical protein